MTRTDRSHLHEPIVPIEHAATQSYNVARRNPLALDANAMASSHDGLEQLLADTMTLRDLYKKHHWQASGPNFYSIHLLFDKHYEEQAAIVDLLAERIQTLGGVAIAMAGRFCGSHQDSACPTGPRKHGGPVHPPFASPRNDPAGSAGHGPYHGGERRPGHERFDRVRCDPQERVASLVPLRNTFTQLQHWNSWKEEN